MNIKIIFRILLLATLVLPIIAIVYTEMSIPYQSKDMQDLLAWDGYGGLMSPVNIDPNLEMIWIGVLVLMLILILVGYVGLFLFKKWGRTITVSITIISFLLTPFMGILVALPVTATIDGISCMLFGIVLSMAYLPPLESEFNKT